MKRFLVVLAIILSGVCCFGQKKTDTLLASVSWPQINDSTGILQYRDLRELEAALGDLPARYVTLVVSWLSARYQLRANELFWQLYQERQRRPH